MHVLNCIHKLMAKGLLVEEVYIFVRWVVVWGRGGGVVVGGRGGGPSAFKKEVMT